MLRSLVGSEMCIRDRVSICMVSMQGGYCSCLHAVISSVHSQRTTASNLLHQRSTTTTTTVNRHVLQYVNPILGRVQTLAGISRSVQVCVELDCRGVQLQLDCANHYRTLLARQPPAGGPCMPSSPITKYRRGPPYPPLSGPKPTNKNKERKNRPTGQKN